MSHIVSCFNQVDAPSNFNDFWCKTNAYNRDGCGRANVLNTCSAKYNPKKDYKALSIKATEYHYKDFFTQKDSVSSRMDCPPTYGCVAYDCGVVGYRVYRKVRRKVECVDTVGGHKKFVNHIKEVLEHKDYKSRPKTILKGGWLVEMHHYIYSFDCREYDPLEHC